MNANKEKKGILSDSFKEYASRVIIQRLMSYVKPYSSMVLIAIIFSVISSALLVIRPYLIKVIIDKYITAGNLNGLSIFMIILIVMYVLMILNQ